ncbi:MAG: NADH-quinone oxidoreductase subunit N, partial [Prevotella sp.]|nr:NADH-quinone oxidoreductase subunit N [Prevotella sp.]
MNYGQFLNMVPEASLVAILIILFFSDFALSKSEKKHPVLRCLTVALLLLQLVPCVLAEPTEVFGGLYVSTAAANAMKLILTGGTLIVAMMADTWLKGDGNNGKLTGEFDMLLVSTLLGMYVMTSSGHFLMFFLGLEMASVPMACLVAMDKWKKDSAEAGAKYILTATFSSAIMLYGISFIYGACGTLYFDDIAAKLSVTPLTIAGLVFFFAGLGFKLSLVPFHFWTADTYQGAPTTVTAYLSVVSKGAAAFALCTILMKVFVTMTAQWEMMLYIVIVLSITIANLFAMRQSELKRFMAFSSISQAGYIMLAVIGNSTMGIASLMF